MEIAPRKISSLFYQKSLLGEKEFDLSLNDFFDLDYYEDRLRYLIIEPQL